MATSVPFAIALLLALVIAKRRHDLSAPERAAMRRETFTTSWSRSMASLGRVTAGRWALISGSLGALLMLAASYADPGDGALLYIVMWLLGPGMIIGYLSHGWTGTDQLPGLDLAVGTVGNFAVWALVAWVFANTFRKKP